MKIMYKSKRVEKPQPERFWYIKLTKEEVETIEECLNLCIESKIMHDKNVVTLRDGFQSLITGDKYGKRESKNST